MAESIERKISSLATAAMQFAARAYPSLVPADGKIVQFKVVGADPQGQKAALADKLAKHMNYQLLEDMEDWEEEMDRLLIQLPIVGCLFKKTYFDPIKKSNVSKLIGPKDLVVNYWATSARGCPSEDRNYSDDSQSTQRLSEWRNLFRRELT
jgi:chaperonin GroES